MSLPTIVQKAFDAQLAELAAVDDAPTGALQWGADLSCVADLEDGFQELAADSARGITQALARRYITPRGAVIDAPDYGCDVRGALNRGLTGSDLRTLHSRMVAEALKDERVESASIELTATLTEIRAKVRVIPRDPALTPFEFVLSVESADVLLELLNTEGGV